MNHCSGCGISGSTEFHWASRRMTMYDVGSNKASRNICIPRQQGQRRYLIYASRSSREGVANACIWSTTRPKANRLRTTHPDEDGPYGHIFATILGRMRAHDGPGQRSPGPAHPPPGWNAGTLNERNTNNRQAILCTGGFQPTDQISGWAPEREHTAQNGKCKLLDVR